MNPLEQQLHYPFGETLPARGKHSGNGAGRFMDTDGPAVCPEPHQSVAD
jgi:hypothetical protein